MGKESTTKKQKNSRLKLIAIMSIIMVGISFYGYATKDAMKERYSIQGNKDQFIFKPSKSYINRTGKEVEEKKTTLSDNYWTGGKFSGF